MDTAVTVTQERVAEVLAIPRSKNTAKKEKKSEPPKLPTADPLVSMWQATPRIPVGTSSVPSAASYIVSASPILINPPEMVGEEIKQKGQYCLLWRSNRCSGSCGRLHTMKGRPRGTGKLCAMYSGCEKLSNLCAFAHSVGELLSFFLTDTEKRYPVENIRGLRKIVHNTKIFRRTFFCNNKRCQRPLTWHSYHLSPAAKETDIPIFTEHPLPARVREANPGVLYWTCTLYDECNTYVNVAIARILVPQDGS